MLVKKLQINAQWLLFNISKEGYVMVDEGHGLDATRFGGATSMDCCKLHVPKLVCSPASIGFRSCVPVKHEAVERLWGLAPFY